MIAKLPATPLKGRSGDHHVHSQSHALVLVRLLDTVERSHARLARAAETANNADRTLDRAGCAIERARIVRDDPVLGHSCAGLGNQGADGSVAEVPPEQNHWTRVSSRVGDDASH
ncbi:MAG: hypothetical protein QOF73_2855 [Thermomicrobiales bacterium]|jgi:hypothetical protein|nr:hypothetical protein [Thermomicrobiales bacterium]